MNGIEHDLPLLEPGEDLPGPAIMLAVLAAWLVLVAGGLYLAWHVVRWALGGGQ